MTHDLEQLRRRAAAAIGKTMVGAVVSVETAPANAQCPETGVDLAGKDVICIRYQGRVTFYSLPGLGKIGVPLGGRDFVAAPPKIPELTKGTRGVPPKIKLPAPRALNQWAKA